MRNAGPVMMWMNTNGRLLKMLPSIQVVSVVTIEHAVWLICYAFN